MVNCNNEQCEFEEFGKCTFCEYGYQCRILRQLSEELKDLWIPKKDATVVVIDAKQLTKWSMKTEKS